MEIIEKLENLCAGYPITKLLDEYNYMNYTMPTEYRVYINEIRKNDDKDLIYGGFEESIDFWRQVLSERKYDNIVKTKELMELLDDLQGNGILSAKERRNYFMRWKNNPEDRTYLIEYLRNIKKN